MLNENIKKILDKILQKDKNFLPIYLKNKTFDFVQIDNFFFKNHNIKQESNLIPLDTILGYVYYVKQGDNKIYIWLWIDRNNHIIEIEFYDMNNKVQGDEIFKVLLENEIEIEKNL